MKTRMDGEKQTARDVFYVWIHPRGDPESVLQATTVVAGCIEEAVADAALHWELDGIPEDDDRMVSALPFAELGHPVDAQQHPPASEEKLNARFRERIRRHVEEEVE